LDLLEAVQDALLTGKYIVTAHLLDEMQAEHLFFVDVKTVVMGAEALNEKGGGEAGNPKVEVLGPTTDGRTIGIVCSVRTDGSVLLITTYEITQGGL